MRKHYTKYDIVASILASQYLKSIKYNKNIKMLSETFPFKTVPSNLLTVVKGLAMELTDRELL